VRTAQAVGPAEAIKRGFRERGLDEVAAMQATRLAATAFSVTITRWLDRDGNQPLSDLVHDTLRACASTPPTPPTSAGPFGRSVRQDEPSSACSVTQAPT
jgi:hypothetical protein